MRIMLTVQDSHPIVYLVEVADEAEKQRLVDHMEKAWAPVEIEVDDEPILARDLMEQNPLDEEDDDG